MTKPLRNIVMPVRMKRSAFLAIYGASVRAGRPASTFMREEALRYAELKSEERVDPSITVHIRVSPEEMSRIDAAARYWHMPPTTYVREESLAATVAQTNQRQRS